MDPAECQIKDVPGISEGLAERDKLPFLKYIKISISRRLGFRFKRSLKRSIIRFMDWIDTHITRRKVSNSTNSEYKPLNFQPGDLVRIRSKEEIMATLDRWNQLRGCTFMPEMLPYCGTMQTVLKLVYRFVDERDRKVKKAKGIILLEDVICEGTSEFGACDRSCFVFWRVEWLEKIS